MKKIVTVFFLTFLLVTCSNDNELDMRLKGTWTLTNVSCFCFFGDNPDFSGHKLTFEGNNLKVENTGEFKFLTDEAGSYTTQDNVITFKNGRQYTFVIKTDVLNLTFVDNPQIADDEIFLSYKQN